ncbi:hypothetical protein [Bacteroides acidifaciens]
MAEADIYYLKSPDKDQDPGKSGQNYFQAVEDISIVYILIELERYFPQTI